MKAADVGTSVSRQLTAVSGLDTVVLVVLAVAAATVFLFSYRSLDKALPIKIRMSVSILRVSIIALCLAILVQPTLHLRTLKSEPAVVAVLLDTSLSMRRGDTSRLSMALSILEREKKSIEALNKNHMVKYFGFDDSLYPVSTLQSLVNNITLGNKTDIRQALEDFAIDGGDNTVQSVIILSDGADTEIGVNENGDWKTDWARKLGFPVNTVLVQDAPTRTDLSVLYIEAPQMAFLRSEISISVTLNAVGITDREIEVFLKQNSAVMQRKISRLVGGKARVTFNILPTELGRQVYEIVTALPENDEIPGNNKQFFSIDVVRDKYRILHLAGRPSWDQRFLRDVLKSWPRVDLVSFYILRTNYQSAEQGSSGMSLIPFPTEEIFNDHLGEFDVLIFHELDPSEVGVESFGEKISNFVKSGGSLAVIGGAKGLQSDTFGSSALEEILPIVLLPPSTQTSRLTERTPFRAKLTAFGAAHPITRRKDDDEENKRLWRGLHFLDGVGRVSGLRKGAYSLLEHPGLSADDGPHPVVSVKETGNGRALAITTDSLWRWRFSGPMTGGPADIYSEFWQKAISWLTRAPDLDRMSIAVTPSPVVFGGKANIDVTLSDETYRPAPNEKVHFEIVWTDSNGIDKKETFESTTDNRGKYSGTWSPQTDGHHRIKVSGGNGIENTVSFLVKTDNREQNHLDAEPAVLKAISETTGGRFEINTLNVKDIAINPKGGREVLSQSALSFWDHPVTISMLLLLLAAEWLLRRRFGMD